MVMDGLASRTIPFLYVAAPEVHCDISIIDWDEVGDYSEPAPAYGACPRDQEKVTMRTWALGSLD